jgi:hypothetical protein
VDNTRPTPLIEDIDGTRRKLETWISAHRGHAVRIPELSIPEATGMSNVTLLFDITWHEDHPSSVRYSRITTWACNTRSWRL